MRVKQIEIQEIELEWIRARIIEKYQSVSNESFEPNSYLKRYDHLCEIMSRWVSPKGEDEYVSQYLLRKLFYDTKDDSAAIFRSGFINGSYRFISDGTANRVEYIRDANKQLGLLGYSKRVRLLSIQGLSTVLFVLWLSAGAILISNHILQPPYIQYFLDDFVLGKNGVEFGSDWLVWDKNDDFWNKSDSLDHLTLFTLQGDYWVKDGETPRIDNLVLRKLERGDFIATIRVNNFKPERNWQQVGLLLIDDDRNSLRFSYGYDDAWPEDKSITSFNSIYLRDGEATHNLPTEDIAIPWYRSFVWLRIQREHNEYSFFYKFKTTDHNWLPVETSWRVSKTFQPEYIGIGAFQGISQTLPDGTVIQLDWNPVPAHVDFFELRPLHYE